MECPICSRVLLDDLATFCRRCGWSMGPEDDTQRAARLAISRERWGEILALRQVVAELQTTCVRSVLREEPNGSPGAATSFV
ncbi:MAG TPA: hypothetical protein VK997_01710, partial [Deferrisomatales bacterium]|nr:hypothetical protein [Deferrisomatales bacterium]